MFFIERIILQEILWLLQQPLSSWLWYYVFESTPMPIDDSFRPNKISHHTPDPLPYSIYVVSVKYVSNFTNPSEYTKFIVLAYDASDTYNIIIRDKRGRSTDKIGYCSRRYDRIICYKKSKFYYSSCYIHESFYCLHVTSTYKSDISILFIEHQNIMELFQLIGVFSSLISAPSPLELVFVLALLLFSWSHSVTTIVYTLLGILALYCLHCIF